MTNYKQRVVEEFFKPQRKLSSRPKVVERLIWEFVHGPKPMAEKKRLLTVRDEIMCGKQHTMTEYLDDMDESVGEFCYNVQVERNTRLPHPHNCKYYGPFRTYEQAHERASNIAANLDLFYGDVSSITVWKYDSRYLDDRKGLWCALEYPEYIKY
jgi:hypothetical protein